MKKASTALVLAAILAAALAIPTGAVPAADDDRAIAHVLNRLGFGPRPGDIDKVRRMGLDRYIDDQLHPERIADAAMAGRLSGLETLTLSADEIAQRYAIPAQQARRQRQQEQAKQPATDTPPERMPRDPDQQLGAVPMADLSQQKILRAVYSERQLQEVLTDFWFNHFNVDARKGQTRFMLTEYERDAVRPHVLGNFRDLLGATAKSPAMLFYLDNWLNSSPGPNMQTMRTQRRGGGRLGRQRGGLSPMPQPNIRPMPQQQQGNRTRGLNENYGRELLELHTLGVDGGYTQKDVTEVARAFTGWSIDQPRQGGGFRFIPMLHDEGEKVVLGHRIKSGGQKDGEAVLDILAAHPATARHIAFQLAQRFVSDNPPMSLVDRLAARFQETKGDLRAVMTTLLTSAEFRAPEALRAKVKTPFEFLVSALRATGAEILNARPLVRSMQELGMPLYQCQPPTGYKDTADAWINTGALVNRMNTALGLVDGTLRAVRVPRGTDPGSLVAGGFSDTTTATIAKATEPPQKLALALGSPEFQRR